MQREDERTQGARHPLLTKQDGIELFHAYGAGLPGLTIAGAAA